MLLIKDPYEDSLLSFLIKDPIEPSPEGSHSCQGFPGRLLIKDRHEGSLLRIPIKGPYEGSLSRLSMRACYEGPLGSYHSLHGKERRLSRSQLERKGESRE